MWDNQRSELHHLYRDVSKFSISYASPIDETINRQPPPRETVQVCQTEGRNLMLAQSMEQMSQTLKVGPAMIAELFAKIPPSKHSQENSAHRYIIDAWQRAELDTLQLMIVTHGEFHQSTTESPGTAMSFDRTFVLTPATADSKAATMGFMGEVLSDILQIRHLNPDPSWIMAFNQPQPSQPFPLPLPNAAPAQMLSSTIEEQNVLVKTFCAETGMNETFSRMCLAEGLWDIQKAIQLFMNAKAANAIPLEAFQH